MVTSSSSKRSGYLQPDWIGTYVLLLVGLLIGVQGVCQTIAGAFQLAARRKIEMIGQTQEVPGLQENMSAAADLEIASTWWPDAEDFFVIGVNEIKLAQTTSDAQKAILLDAGAALLQRSIVMAPANAAAWLWLAYAQFLKQGPSPQVVDDLAMSIELSPFDPSLTELRCQIGLASYDLLSRERQQTVNQQIRLLARISLPTLLKLAQQAGRSALVKSILGS